MVTSRIWFTAKQKSELWERWRNGQSAAAISRALDRRNKTGVLAIVVRHGGIAPAPRRRALAALRLEELPWHCGGPVAAADRPGPWTGAINSKSGDQAQRRQRCLSCKPCRQKRLGASVASQALSPGAA